MTARPHGVHIVDGTLRCLARQGLAKTTVDDIAREAKLSRATLYRTFPGGKDAIVAAVVETEVARLFSSLAPGRHGRSWPISRMSSLPAWSTQPANSLRTLPGHHHARVRARGDPGHFTFADLDRVLFVAGDFAAPFFARWLSPDEASRAAEWAVRIVSPLWPTPPPTPIWPFPTTHVRSCAPS